MNWETLMCIGDSITIGSRSYLGYPEQCAHYLSLKTNKDWNVYNCAKAGFTSIDLVRHMDSVWGDLTLVKPDILSIMIGTNDLKTNTSLEDFNIAFKQLVIKSILIVGNSNIVLCKIPLLQKGVMLPYKREMNEKLALFNESIEEIAESKDLFLLEILSEPDHFFDGVHINSKGAAVWGKQLGDFILNLRH